MYVGGSHEDLARASKRSAGRTPGGGCVHGRIGSAERASAERRVLKVTDRLTHSYG